MYDTYTITSVSYMETKRGTVNIKVSMTAQLFRLVMKLNILENVSLTCQILFLEGKIIYMGLLSTYLLRKKYNLAGF